MTNYCQNKLTVDGSREDISIFAAQCLTQYNQLCQLDFEKITPKPQIIRGLTRKVRSKLGYDYPAGSPNSLPSPATRMVFAAPLTSPDRRIRRDRPSAVATLRHVVREAGNADQVPNS